jgi:hypothetical protein
MPTETLSTPSMGLGIEWLEATAREAREEAGATIGVLNLSGPAVARDAAGGVWRR